MKKIFKNMIPYWYMIIPIILLLAVQAFGDLSLPQYTSDIIDVGIQNNGVEHILPEKITKEEFERLHGEFKRKAAEFEDAQKKQEVMIKELFKNGVLSAGRLKTMQDCSELKEIDRYTLCSMVKQISVFENHRIEIEFYYTDQYRIMREINKRMMGEKLKNRPEERSA